MRAQDARLVLAVNEAVTEMPEGYRIELHLGPRSAWLSLWRESPAQVVSFGDPGHTIAEQIAEALTEAKRLAAEDTVGAKA